MRRSTFALFSACLLSLACSYSCSSSSSGPSATSSGSGDPGSGDTLGEGPPGSAASTAEPASTDDDAGPATSSAPTDPNVLYVGRFDLSDPKGPRATWPGSRILTRFEGTAISVTLSERAEDWMGGAPSYWEVSIDRGDWRAIPMIADDAPHVFELARDLPPGEHLVEIYKRSETQTGMTQFLGFDYHGGRPLGAPPRQQRRIEVMGDSQSTGFGIEMIDAPETDCPGADHSGQYQNFRRAWGALLGRIFDAEVHGIVYSGKGVLRNVWGTDNDPLIDYYARANPNPAIANSSPPLFDLTSWIPDVIVMMQGAVDFNIGIDYGQFREAYRTFIVDQLRARAPQAHIFMGVMGKGGREAIATIANELIEERKAQGDDRLHAFSPILYHWQEMLGCNGHGVPSYHERVANEMAAEIHAKVGW